MAKKNVGPFAVTGLAIKVSLANTTLTCAQGTCEREGKWQLESTTQPSLMRMSCDGHLAYNCRVIISQEWSSTVQV